MKFIHLSDLHIGKRVNEFSMIEDQIFILKQILAIIDREQPDGVLIAGDVYDRPVPSTEAVEVLDDFLVNLAERKLPVFIISGNHDSAQRLAFACRLMEKSSVYVSPVYNGTVEPVSLTDQWGNVNLYMLPFLKPAQVKPFFPDREIDSYTQAVEAAVTAMGIDRSQRNILITHQFVTGAARCESEELSVGGADNVDARVFDAFDYVALGHLHSPQQAGEKYLRYCGTPLKYSFSEAEHKKSLTIAELKKKGELIVTTQPLIPMRDMKKIRGTYMEVTDKRFYNSLRLEDYFHITLTDEEDIPDAAGRLRSVYPNLMRLEYDNRRTRSAADWMELRQTQAESPAQLFAAFYRQQNDRELTEEQADIMDKLIRSIWEEEV